MLHQRRHLWGAASSTGGEALKSLRLQECFERALNTWQKRQLLRISVVTEAARSAMELLCLYQAKEGAPCDTSQKDSRQGQSNHAFEGSGVALSIYPLCYPALDQYYVSPV